MDRVLAGAGRSRRGDGDGDLVVFEDEVDPVMSALLDAGLQVRALHNHFAYDDPRVLFMHIGGEGSVTAIGQGVRQALDAIAARRAAVPQPARGSGNRPLPATSELDAAALEQALDVKGTARDGHVQGRDGPRRPGGMWMHDRQSDGRQHLGRVCRQG